MAFSPFGGTMDLMFNIMPIFFVIFFILFIGILITQIVRGANEWHKNNESPVLTVDALLVSKREDVHIHHHNGTDSMAHSTSSTTYYVTFEVPSKDRLEFTVSGSEYGMLAERDQGRLTFQGTRFLSFERG